MKYYKITNKRLSVYKKALELHQLMDETWKGYIEKLQSLKNEKGVRLVPEFSGFTLANPGVVYMLPNIHALRFKFPVQLKAIRDRIWAQAKHGFYVLHPQATKCVAGATVYKVLNSYTSSITIYTFYKGLFGIDPVPFGSEDAPKEINKAVEEEVIELCKKGVDPVVLLVPRFFVTTDDIAVIGLPEQMPYVKGIKELVDKKQMVGITEEEAKELNAKRKFIINPM